MFDRNLFERAVANERSRSRRSAVFGFLLAVVLLSPVGWLLATLMEVDRSRRLIAAPLIIAALLIAGLASIRLLQGVASQFVLSVVHPGGRSRGPVGNSRAEALVASGRIEEATAEFEAMRAKSGDTVASLRAEAELHAQQSGDPKRAEALYQRIRRLPDASASDELHATHRLIDLYLGALNDSGRAMVELRRMADRFPDTIDGQGALAELKRRRDAGQV